MSVRIHISGEVAASLLSEPRASKDALDLWEVGIREVWSAGIGVKTKAITRAIVKERFRKRHGLNPNGQQDPVCVRHRWTESYGLLECIECGDVDDLWVPGWCPSGGCFLDGTSCDKGDRPAEGCPRIFRNHRSHPDELTEESLRMEQEEDERRLVDEEDSRRYVERYTGGRSGREYIDKDDPRIDHIRPVSPNPRARKMRESKREQRQREQRLSAVEAVEAVDTPTTLKGLRELGGMAGIKCFSRMNSGTLCNLLGLPPAKGKPRKPVTIILTDQETGEVLKFPSISGTARYLGDINPESVSYYVRSARTVKAVGRTFTVSKG